MKQEKDYRVYAKENQIPIMQEDGIRFLCGLIQDAAIHRVLEVGTAIGYSALAMAQTKPDVEVDSLEIDEARYQEARKNVEEARLTDRVHLYLQDAVTFVPTTSYDCIFIDGPKAQYRAHMEHFQPYLAPGGIFVFDNLNFHGFVDDFSLTHNRRTLQMVHKIRAFRDYLLESPFLDTDFHKTIGDGIAVVKIRQTR